MNGNYEGVRLPEDKGVRIPKAMIKSKALRELSGRAIYVLLIFYYKRVMKLVPKLNAKKGKEYICINNGNITFYYSEAQKKYRISRKTFSRIIDELVEFGFIDIARAGIGYGRIPTLYSISERWRKFGTQEFEKAKRTKQVLFRGVNSARKKKKKCNFRSVKSDTCQVSEMTLISNVA